MCSSDLPGRCEHIAVGCSDTLETGIREGGVITPAAAANAFKAFEPEREERGRYFGDSLRFWQVGEGGLSSLRYGYRRGALQRGSRVTAPALSRRLW